MARTIRRSQPFEFEEDAFLSKNDTPKSGHPLIFGIVAVALVWVFTLRGKLLQSRIAVALRVDYLPVTGHAKFVVQEDGLVPQMI
jgi:hypothetical protein